MKNFRFSSIFRQSLLDKSYFFSKNMPLNVLSLGHKSFFNYAFTRPDSQKIIDGYVLHYEKKTTEEYTNFISKQMALNLDGNADEILEFLAKRLKKGNLDRDERTKLQKSSQIIARYVHDHQKRKNLTALKIKSKEGLLSLIDIMRNFPLNFSLSFSTEICINCMANMIKDGILKPTDLEEVFGRILEGNKILHTRIFPRDSGSYLNKQLIVILEDSSIVKNDIFISRISEFVHSFRDFPEFKRNFDQIRTILKKNIFARLEDKLKIGLDDDDLFRLLVCISDYTDISPKECSDLLQKAKAFLEKNAQINKNQAMKFIIDSYSKLSQGNPDYLSKHFVPIYSILLASDNIKTFEFSSLSTNEIKNLGELINLNTLSAGSVFNILVSSLEISQEEKRKFSITKTRYFYEINVQDKESSEYLELFSEGQMGNNLIMNNKDLMTHFFVKNTTRFSFKGLLLMLLSCFEKATILGKYQTFLYFEFKRKAKELNQDQLQETLQFIKNTANQKNKFLTWIIAFEDGIQRLFDLSDPAEYQQITEMIIKGRIDLTLSPFRTFDMLLDKNLAKAFPEFNFKSIELLLSNLVGAKVQSSLVYQMAFEQFESSFRLMQPGTSTNLLLKFTLQGSKVSDNAFDWIFKSVIDQHKMGSPIGHATPFKLIAAIVLAGKFGRYDSGSYEMLFNAMLSQWEDQYTEFEKEEIFGTNFVNNQLLFIKYIELFYPTFYKDYFLTKPNGKKIITMTKGKITRKFSITGGKMESDLVRVIKSISKEIKIQENTFIFDGLLECDLKLRNEKSNKEIIVEFFGPSHFESNSSFEFRKTTGMILDIKRTICPVIVVPIFEWSELSEQQKISYAKRKILAHLE